MIRHEGKLRPTITLVCYQKQKCGRCRGYIFRKSCVSRFSDHSHNARTAKQDEDMDVFWIECIDYWRTNAANLSNKMGELLGTSSSNNVHLIVISEISISRITDQELLISVASLSHEDRKLGTVGGAVLYLRSCLVAHQVYTRRFISFDQSVLYS